MPKCEREDQSQGVETGSTLERKITDKHIERIIRRRLDEMTRSSVDNTLALGYASLNDGIGYTYGSLREIYEDFVPVSRQRSLAAQAPPPFGKVGSHVYVFSAEARQDLRSIRSRLSRRENVGAGWDAIRQIICDISLLAQMPRLETRQPELQNAPTNLPGQFAIYYHATRKPRGIMIVRVPDGDGYFDLA